MVARARVDGIDEAILGLLEEDGRRSFADIGGRVGLSASAVKRRVDRLEAVGVIAGYTAVIDHRALGRSLEAFTELRFPGTANIEDIRATIQAVPEVHTMFVTAGDPDAVVWLRVDGIEGLRRTIEQFRLGGKVIGTKTLMILETWRRGGTP